MKHNGLVYDFVACLSIKFSKYKPIRKSARHERSELASAIFVSRRVLATRPNVPFGTGGLIIHGVVLWLFLKNFITGFLNIPELSCLSPEHYLAIPYIVELKLQYYIFFASRY